MIIVDRLKYKLKGPVTVELCNIARILEKGSPDRINRFLII